MEIKEFARECYDATFPLFAKSEVNGTNTNECFRWLRRNTKTMHNAETDRSRVIPWNFTKFLYNTKSEEIVYFDPRAKKDDIVKAIDTQLAPEY